jgi:hypothetical protein
LLVAPAGPAGDASEGAGASGVAIAARVGVGLEGIRAQAARTAAPVAIASADQAGSSKNTSTWVHRALEGDNGRLAGLGRRQGPDRRPSW